MSIAKIQTPPLPMHGRARIANAFIAFALIAPLVIPMGGEALVLLCALIGMVGIVGTRLSTSRHSEAGFVWRQDDTWMALALGSMVALQLISVLWSEWPRQSLSSAIKHVHFALWPFLVWVFSRATAPQDMLQHGLLAALLLATVWMALPTQVGWAAGQFEAAAQNTSVLGKIVAVMGLWALVLASGMQRSKQDGPRVMLSLWMRYAMALAWALALLLLVASERRIELGLYVVLSMSFIMLRLFKRGQLRLALSLTCAAAILIGLALAHQSQRFKIAGDEVRQYFSGQQPHLKDYQTSLGQRMEMYHMALRAIADKPVLGWGAGTRPHYLKQYAHYPQHIFERTHLHSQYLQTLVDVGIVGAMIAIAALIVAFRISVVATWRRGQHEVAALFLALYAVHMMSGVFNPAFSQGLSNSFFVLMAAVLWTISRTHVGSAANAPSAL
jgi:O-antigen ligase